VNRPALNTQAATLQKKKTGKGVDSQVSDQPSELTTVDVKKQTPYDGRNDLTEERKVTTNNTDGAPLTIAADKPVTDKSAGTEKKNTGQVDDPSKKSPSKTKDSRGSNFAFTFSAGPDFSSLYFSEPGEWRMGYGVGVIYSLTK